MFKLLGKLIGEMTLSILIGFLLIYKGIEGLLKWDSTMLIFNILYGIFLITIVTIITVKNIKFNHKQ